MIQPNRTVIIAINPKEQSIPENGCSESLIPGQSVFYCVTIAFILYFY